jgi:hypothetical protein
MTGLPPLFTSVINQVQRVKEEGATLPCFSSLPASTCPSPLLATTASEQSLPTPSRGAVAQSLPSFMLSSEVISSLDSPETKQQAIYSIYKDEVSYLQESVESFEAKVSVSTSISVH